jgi:hypothetical protein
MKLSRLVFLVAKVVAKALGDKLRGQAMPQQNLGSALHNANELQTN